VLATGETVLQTECNVCTTGERIGVYPIQTGMLWKDWQTCI